MLKIIAAIDEENGIGIDGQLPWDLPSDLKRFKELTIDSTVIMGRNTLESIGKPLERRLNIVISHSDGLSISGTSTSPLVHVKTIEQALKLAKNDAWIIGGETIYNQFIDFSAELWITHIQGKFNCNKFFPKIDEAIWDKQLIKTKQENNLTYAYSKYSRKNSL
jgi:dihydrofolate reductase